MRRCEPPPAIFAVFCTFLLPSVLPPKTDLQLSTRNAIAQQPRRLCRQDRARCRDTELCFLSCYSTFARNCLLPTLQPVRSVTPGPNGSARCGPQIDAGPTGRPGKQRPGHRCCVRRTPRLVREREKCYPHEARKALRRVRAGMRCLSLLDFTCSLRVIDRRGRPRWQQRTARLSVRRSPLA